MYYDIFDTSIAGTLTLAGDEQGLCWIGFLRGKHPVVIGGDWIKKASFFTDIRQQLTAYFAGERQDFDVRLAPRGTVFQLKVWESLRKIPYGELVSYKSIAEDIGSPKAVRAVGAANGRNPLPIVVPCHRVIGSNGQLTGFGGGLDVKQRLIDLERRVAGKADQIDLPLP
ncbi:MAG: methylated-DNA--[protein]-cysteine S-methyltransferase [Desulfobacteraceae bacterium]|nr:methylated-DNA--[protein]-cysteine S-methyltransferase [Desulfobacteraceae bacterium]